MLGPASALAPHTGATNAHLTCHLGVAVPGHATLTVAEEVPALLGVKSCAAERSREAA